MTFEYIIPFISEVDPRLVTPPPVVESSGWHVYGVRPPESKSIDDLCPPPVQCPDCPEPKEIKCPSPGVSYFDLMGKLVVRPFSNTTYPGLPNRATGESSFFGNCKFAALFQHQRASTNSHTPRE